MRNRGSTLACCENAHEKLSVHQTKAAAIDMAKFMAGLSSLDQPLAERESFTKPLAIYGYDHLL